MVSASGLRTRLSLLQGLGGFAAALGLFDGAAPHEFQQARFQAEVGFPQARRRRRSRCLPRCAIRRCARASRCPGDDRTSRNICGASHEGTCTPLVMWPMGTCLPAYRERGRSTWRAKLRRAARKPRWRGGKASGPAPSCRILRWIAGMFTAQRHETRRARGPAPRAAGQDALRSVRR